jgi:hypothetical protein
MNLKTLVRANVDRALAVALVVAAALLLLLGWLGVSGVALAAQQIPYLISGGLGGILLGAVGITLWLSADLHDEWRRLDSLEAVLSDLVEARSDAPAPVVASEPVPLAAAVVSNGRSRTNGRVSKTLA